MPDSRKSASASTSRERRSSSRSCAARPVLLPREKVARRALHLKSVILSRRSAAKDLKLRGTCRKPRSLRSFAVFAAQDDGGPEGHLRDFVCKAVLRGLVLSA